MLTKTKNNPKKEIITQIQHLETKCAVDASSFSQFDQLLQEIAKLKKSKILSRADLKEICFAFSDDFLQNTMQGFALRKPYGYTGDFSIIDCMYTKYISNESRFKNWDVYFQNHACCQAVRNRKTYFKDLLALKLSSNQALNLLNVASGPGRDMLEVYQQLKQPARLQTTCVDMDKQAIIYASELNRAYLSFIQFTCQNIYKYEPKQQYDLIWSAGLFDYFDDNDFVVMLKKCKEWIVPRGEIVIGNFNEAHSPSRNYMELMGEWFLHYRTEEQLARLAELAGFKKDQIRIGREPSKVNLFLHILN